MRGTGLFGLIRLAVTLAIALPMALFGIEFLLAGRQIGLAFVVIAALLIGLQHYLTNPFDPGDIAEAAVDRVSRDDE